MMAMLDSLSSLVGKFFSFKNDPVVLTASADGVGSKSILAADYGIYEGLGIDLVAMCVNDLVCKGSRPLFFLDYIGFNRVEESIFHTLIESIQKGCREAGCVLMGGETAEMPEIYNKNYFDLAGFAVGTVEERNLLPKEDIELGDLILGLPSSGVHSNGFSLIRKIIKECKVDPRKETLSDGTPLIDALMTPTTIYVNTVLELAKNKLIQGCAHITGGGLNNIRRILPRGMDFELSTKSWDLPPVFQWIKNRSYVASPSSETIDFSEMRAVFNCGYGMALVVRQKELQKLQEKLGKMNTNAKVIGKVVSVK